jgi:lipoate-protein ligase A
MIKPALRFVRLQGVPIFQQLQLEEVLMRLDPEHSYCIFNASAASALPTVVTGLGGKIPDLVDLEKTERDSIPIIRRYTGGGTVIVDSNTVYVTFIMKTSTHPEVMPYPRDIMTWSERFYGPLFEAIHPKNAAELKFSLRENDYVFGNLKIGGNAQSISSSRWVHHTSFLWNYDSENMQYLLMPKKRPAYRDSRNHASFLTTMAEQGVEISDFESMLSARCGELYDVEEREGAETLSSQESLVQESNKTASTPWKYRTRFEA